MGVSNIIVNFDKKEFIRPGPTGDGSKIWELLANGDTARLLLYLMDGRWEDDSIRVVRDSQENTYATVLKKFKDITYEVIDDFNGLMEGAPDRCINVPSYYMSEYNKARPGKQNIGCTKVD